jgi:type I restriction enzyme S subunit
MNNKTLASSNEENMDEVKLPEGWSILPLGKCIEILDNFRVPINNEERRSRQGSIPYYGATGQVGWIDDFLFDEELLLLGEDGAPFNDKSKSIAYIIHGKSWVNNHAHVLRAIKEITSNSYLKHYLNSFDFSEYITGSTRDKLNQGAMKRIPILLPPLAEQQRIVAYIETLLSHTNTAFEKLSRVPSIINKFRQVVLESACSGRLTDDWENHEQDWEIVQFGDILERNPQNGLYLPQSEYGDGYPIVRIDDFHNGILKSWSLLKRVRLSRHNAEKYFLEENDLLINRVNSMKHLGKSLLIQKPEEKIVFECNMIRFKLKKMKISPNFAVLYLLSTKGLEELRKNAKHAVNQSSINQTDICSISFPLPPLAEQYEIVRRVNTLFAHADSVERVVETASKRAEALTQAVLGKAFTGKL